MSDRVVHVAVKPTFIVQRLFHRQDDSVWVDVRGFGDRYEDEAIAEANHLGFASPGVDFRVVRRS